MHDAVGRPQSSLVRAGASPARFWEQTSFSPRSLASASTRWDLTGKGEAHRYDGAGRLTLSESTQEPTKWIPNNAVSPPATLDSIAEGAAFAYTSAEHLEYQATKKEEQRSDKRRIVEVNLLPEDASGRHRPGFANDKLLLWDGNGNLTRKGELEYFYDYRNRLSRVTRDGVGEIATYDYDALNRRVYRRVAGEERQTVWSGWRSIEEYAEAGLASRRVFGLGLDDMVRQEVDTDADGVLDATQLPIFDRTGNLVVLTDASGTPIERYEYGPYGPTKIEVDNTPPQLAQIRRSESGTVVVEFSEGISGEALREKLGLPEPGASFRVDGLDLPLIYLGAPPQGLVGGETAVQRFDGGPTVTLDWVEVPGREHGRAFRLTPSTPIAAGSTVEITFEAEAIEDFFANLMPQAITQTFVWPAEAAAITDSAAPEVERIVAMPDRVEVLFTEPVTPASVAAAITVDGETRPWTDIGSGYRFQTTLSLPPGPHAVDVSTALQDLAGKQPTGALNVAFTMAGAQSQIPYEKPDPQAISASAAQNVYGWKGLPRDRETGFLYVRNRYYDPEIGRFITADPLGYVDGPSAYAFAGNSPANAGDPIGLALYAFDGTGNHRLRMTHPTNVEALWKAYSDPKVYEPGVGTDDIFGNQIVCGLTGCGGAARIDDAMKNLELLWNSGDQEIDIVGFSRGAAEARQFANRIYREGVFDARLGKRVVPRIRFLGLFDTVGLFGWPGNRANLGYELSIPPIVAKVRQAVAADERRGFFPLSSIKEFEGQENTARATERYFTGSHSDCGGGYSDDARLAERSLYWMWQETLEAGVPLAPWKGAPPERALIGGSLSGERFCVPKVHDSRYFLDLARDAIASLLGGRIHRMVYYYPLPAQ